MSDRYTVGTCAHFLRTKGPSGFGSGSTAHTVAAEWDGSHSTIIVTGCSGGLGLESVRVLAGRGADVIMAVRDVSKVSITAGELREELPSASITVMELDLASLKSVRAFAKAFLATGKPLNTLLQNGAVMACPFSLSADGHEMQFATNHLGHFLLTHLLLDHMLATARDCGVQGRIVTVASTGHMLAIYNGGVRFNMLDSQEGYDPWKSYGQSKLCNILHTRELNRRLQGMPVAAVCCHPGNILTNLARHVEAECMSGALSVLKTLLNPLLKSIPQGAATQVYLATAQSVAGGEYYLDVNIRPSSKLAHDRRLGEKLWEVSEILTGVGKRAFFSQGSPSTPSESLPRLAC
ncbi:MAG: hypothetical protein WDW38_008246 [Sanguina aurantia]